MMKISNLFLNKDTKDLVAKLRTFYENEQNYGAFHEESNQSDSWKIIVDDISNRLTLQTDKIKILEIGAGKTGFYRCISPLKDKIHFTTQDVHKQNIDHLSRISDSVIIGDLTESETISSEKYNIIFSTYVYEHVVNPEILLDKLMKSLTVNGVLYIFSPRYDFPFYISPSASHYKLTKRILLSLWLLKKRFQASYYKSPSFLVHNDPSIFHLEYKRDFDAIHWVSSHDIKAYCIKHRYKLNKVIPKSKSFLGYFYNNFMSLHIKIETTDNE